MMANDREHCKERIGGEDGQSLVEFAASLVVLLLVLMAVLDIGRAFFTFVAIENAAGEGAIFASYHPTWVTQADATAGGADYPEYENVVARTMNESPSSLVDWSQASVEVQPPPLLQTGQPITVTVHFSYTLLTPFMSSLLQDSMLHLKAEASQVILNVD